jgi:phage/plasmid-like protein (TIGR03299 family)
MSANIDSMLFVNEVPWHGLGRDMTANPPKSSEEIIQGASLDWSVGAIPMITDLHSRVEDYHAIYRQDTQAVLGAVNKANPIIVQNRDTFTAVDHLLGKDLDVETAASLGNGEIVFGCFKISNTYRILDDDVDHYFVIMNEHLKPDGKVTVLNTPVRVVCQNTLSYALSNNLYRLRVPISTVQSINETIASKLFVSVDNALSSLQKKAEDMVSKKIDKQYVDRLLDELFPYANPDNPESMFSKQNEMVSQLRATFLNKCMGADNLANYRGTQWQVLNSVIDWDDHFYKNMTKAYDINHRMKRLPGIGDMTGSKTITFLKIADKLAA